MTISRTGKSVSNIVSGLFSQAIILVMNFLVRVIFLRSLGSEYLGINSLFTNILTILSVADLGFGSALGITLYAALAKKEENEIAGLMNFFKKVYFIIGAIVTAAGLAICPFVQYLVKSDTEFKYLSLYFLFFLLNTVSSYFISYRTILIRADQKNSVVNNVTTVVKMGKAVLEALVLCFGPKYLGIDATFFIYLAIMVIATYAIGIITSVYAKKHYSYAFQKSIKISPEKKNGIVSTTKDLLIYRLSSAFASPIDAILISMLGISVLGYYDNYLLIVTTILEFICILSRNVISSVGNFVVEKPIEEQKKLYFEIQTIYFAIIIFAVINFIGLVSPFVKIAFGNESVLSMGVVFLLGGNVLIKCIGELAIIFRETTKIYKKTRFISLAYTIVHIGLSILFGYFMGMEGILLGNIVAYLLTNFWFEIRALFKHYFKSPYAKIFLCFALVIIVSFGIGIGEYFLFQYLSSINQAFFALECLISLIISCLAILILYPMAGFKDILHRGLNIIAPVINKIKNIYQNVKAQKIIFISYFVIVGILLAFRDFSGINVSKYIFLGIFILFVLLSKKTNAYFIIFFTLPFAPTIAELYVLAFSLLYIFVTNLKNHSIKGWILAFIVPVFLAVDEICLSYFYGQIDFQVTLRIFVTLCLLAICFYDRKSFTRRHLLAFVAGFCFMSLIIAVNYLTISMYAILNQSQGTAVWNLNLFIIFREVRFSKAFAVSEWVNINCGIVYPIKAAEMILGDNPNNIGLMSIISLTIIFSFYGTFARKQKKYLLALAILSFIFGVWSLSRTWIIFFAIFLIFAIFYRIVIKRTKFIDAFIILLLLVFIGLIVVLINPNFIQAIIKRFQDKSIETGGNRFSLLVDYLKFLFSDIKYVLFGVSCTNLFELAKIGTPPHTNFVQFVCSYGVPVTVLFVAFIIVALIKTKNRIKLNNPKILFYLPMLFAVGFTLALQLFYPSIILICFIPTAIATSFNNKNSEKQCEFIPNMFIKKKNGEKLKTVICSLSFAGGIGTYISNLAEGLSDIENFHEISLLVNPNTSQKEIDELRFKNLHIETFKQTKKKHKISFLRQKYNYYISFFEKENPDLIYINFSDYTRAFILIFAAIRYRRAAIVLHTHVNMKTEKGYIPLSSRLCRFFLSFFYMFQFSCSKESGMINFGKSFKDKKRSLVVNNFVDEKRFAFSNIDRKNIREKYDIKDDEIILGNVGRLSKQKNQKFLLNLILMLPDKYHLFIVGDGELKEQLEEYINDSDIQNRVTLVPNNQEIEKYYSAFDYFCLPSTFEGLPFVCIEAQCSGLPVMVSEFVSKEAKLSDDYLILPLDEMKWRKTLIKSIPFDNKNRLNGPENIIKAGYTKNSVISSVEEFIKHKMYE